MSAAAAVTPDLNGVRKAAVLLVLLGEEAAAAVYRHLSQTQLQRLTQEIRELSGVQPDTAVEVLEEYRRLSLAQDYLAQGGESYARSLLVKAFGVEGAKDLLDQVNRAQVLTANQMDACRKRIPKSWRAFSKASSRRPSPHPRLPRHQSCLGAVDAFAGGGARGSRSSGWRCYATFRRRWRRRSPWSCTNGCNRWASRTAASFPGSRVPPT